MKKERLRTVLEQIKYSGKITAESMKDLTHHEKQLIEELHGKGLIETYLDATHSLNVDDEWIKFKRGLNTEQTPVIPFWKNIQKYAAAAIILLTTTLLIQTPSHPTGREQQIPEGDVITLRTGNQGVTIIDHDESGHLFSASGEVIAEQRGNRIKYLSESQLDTLVYNELEIPYGKVFELELSDGTLVYLNAGTTIKYPIKFIQGQKREVYVQGEGFFKVAKDRDHPFLVHSDAVTVEVLGTEFNMSSYPENLAIETVLVEGSVAVHNSNVPSAEMVLKPGNKGVWNKVSLTTEISDVDIEQYTSWVGGELVFRDTPFQEVLIMLERRYNVKIENKARGLDQKKLNARFSVEVETIDDVLKSMGRILSYDYEIDEKGITIK